MSGIDFYFSIGSTYTYLSVTRILDVEKQHQVKFNWKPFSVRAIMKEMNNIPFPKDKIISEAKSSDIETKYNKNTSSARENKIFGSPSFIVKNELFWGDDRMEDAIKWSHK